MGADHRRLQGCTQVDAEWHALRSGIKPALRISGSPAELASIAARYASLGFSTVVARGTVGGAAGDVLYVGRSALEAEAARAAEAPVLAPSARPSRLEELASIRRLGAALGYPPCCVEGFCGRYAISPHGRFRRDYRAARAAWVPSARWALNHLLRASNWTVVPFEPCRYDCEAAHAYAELVLAAIAAADAAGRALVEAHLRHPVVVSITGARATVTLDPAGMAIASAEAPCPPGGAARPLDARFARELPGALVSAAGTLRLGRRRALLVDFSEDRAPSGAEGR